MASAASLDAGVYRRGSSVVLPEILKTIRFRHSVFGLKNFGLNQQKYVGGSDIGTPDVGISRIKTY